MNPEGMAAWYYQGDGLKLWEETYAAFNLVPRPGPSTASQMAGWFRKKINTIGDYKGLKMRIPGLGGKVVAKAGGTVVLTPGGEIYAALERGVIDAAEWVGPHDDMKLGLHKTARYYYYPGWHEPGTTAEFGFNKKAYEALPVDLRRMLDHAARRSRSTGSRTTSRRTRIALEKLKTEFKGKVEILQLPAPVLQDLKKLAAEVVKEESEKSPMARKVHASFTKFQALISRLAALISEGAYQHLIAGLSAARRPKQAGRSRWAPPRSSSRLVSPAARARISDAGRARGIRDHDGEPDQLERDERDHAAVDVAGRDLGRRHAAQVEEREAEGRREEGGLEVDADHDAEPDRIEAEVRRPAPASGSARG